MSRKNVLSASIGSVIAGLPISHLTREGYERIGADFATFLVHAGFTHLSSAEDLGGRHLRAFIKAKTTPSQGDAPSIRALQNEAAILRGIYRAAGLSAIADAPELSNRALGISGGSRIGRKTPLTPEEFQSIQEKAKSMRRPGIAAMLKLALVFGLRHFEALMANVETLKRWLIEVEIDGAIVVARGTKGGRSRRVIVTNSVDAIDAISTAIAIADKQGGYLVTQHDGRPARDLRHARSIARNWCSRNGVTPHALRYGFAQRRFLELLAKGVSKREALALISLDLGHGSGRGRWASSVYLRSISQKNATNNETGGDLSEDDVPPSELSN